MFIREAVDPIIELQPFLPQLEINFLKHPIIGQFYIVSNLPSTFSLLICSTLSFSSLLMPSYFSSLYLSCLIFLRYYSRSIINNNYNRIAVVKQRVRQSIKISMRIMIKWLYLADELISIIKAMKPQQDPDLELNEYEEDEEEEDQGKHEFGQDNQHNQKYTALATLIALTVVLLLILLGLKIATSLEEIPKIYMEYQQEVQQPKREERSGRYIQLQQVKPSFEEMVSQVKIQASSPGNMVEVESSNSIHRNFQQTMRKIQSENAHMQLDKHKTKQFSKQSSMSYQHYLQALDLLQLITFPPDEYSKQQGMLANQERLYYNQRYDIRSTNTESSICVVLALTREGLQNGGYYVALKSIFQQEYNNFKVIVIDNPEMRMLEDVQKLLREMGRSKVTLLERVKSEEITETSFFVEGAVGKYCKESAMTLLLRDTGQLIGREVFNVINKIYEDKQPEIIFTHYLLQPFNPLRQSIETFRYKIQLYPQNIAQSRSRPYRTKYLKVYRTDLLLRLQDRVFQKSDGHWTKDLFEANLQFSILQLSCGKYHLINEIMYMASKYDIESPIQVLDARKHQQLSCYLQTPLQLRSQTQLKVNP